MAMPKRIGGPPEGKPGLSITVISAKKPKIPTRIGGPREEEPADESEDMGGEPISNEQAMEDAAQELITALGAMKPDPRRVADALRAAVYACNDDEEGSE